jgi:hypothetical protein
MSKSSNDPTADVFVFYESIIIYLINNLKLYNCIDIKRNKMASNSLCLRKSNVKS